MAETDENKISCQRCGERLTREELFDHMEQAHDRNGEA